MHSRYKAVVFDFGGVIETVPDGNPLQQVADILGITLDQYHEEYFKHNHLTNVDGLPWEETVARVAGIFTDSKDLIERSRQIIVDHIARRRINHELVGFFSHLRQQNYKVGIFSNNSARLRDQLAREGILDLVDTVVISGEIGFQKPRQEAFAVLFDKLSLRPDEVVFIDDAPKSLEGANELGYTPILYRSNEQLRQDLKKIGIEF